MHTNLTWQSQQLLTSASLRLNIISLTHPTINQQTKTSDSIQNLHFIHSLIFILKTFPFYYIFLYYKSYLRLVAASYYSTTTPYPPTHLHRWNYLLLMCKFLTGTYAMWQRAQCAPSIGPAPFSTSVTRASWLHRKKRRWLWPRHTPRSLIRWWLLLTGRHQSLLRERHRHCHSLEVGWPFFNNRFSSCTFWCKWIVNSDQV